MQLTKYAKQSTGKFNSNFRKENNHDRHHNPNHASQPEPDQETNRRCKMKFIIGLLIGAGLAYGWFTTYGRLQRTDVVVEIQTNVVTRVKYETVFATQEIYRTVWQTNTVTVTNVVKKVAAVPKTPRANIMYVPDTPTRTPSTVTRQQPAPTQPAKVAPARSGFQGPRNLPGRDRYGNTTNRNVHIKM